jgi:hypothetical protein
VVAAEEHRENEKPAFAFMAPGPIFDADMRVLRYPGEDALDIAVSPR